MLELCVCLSCMIAAIYCAFGQGNILGWFRIWCANGLDRAFGKKASRYIQKPLWDCLACMASLWSVILMWTFDIMPDTPRIFFAEVLITCGLNYIIDNLLLNERDTDTERVD